MAKPCVACTSCSVLASFVVSARWRPDAEQAIEERRLPRAVRTDQPDALALVDLDAHPVERGDPREPLRQLVRDEYRAHETSAGCGEDAGVTPGVALSVPELRLRSA